MVRNWFRGTVISLCIGGAVCSCAHTNNQSFNTESLTDLEQMTLQNTTDKELKVSKIRLQALKDTALSIGAQGGLALRSQQIVKMLAQNEKQLDEIYNFNGLMLDNNVLAPVLVQSDQSLNIDGPDLITISDRAYKIEKQARFVTASPTWRDYLWMNYKKPELPDSTLLPKDDQERKVWIDYIHIGWKKGVEQANAIYAENLATLKRDYAGMMLYRKLLDQGVVSKPFVAKTEQGVLSNGDNTELQINNRMLRITAEPKFNPNSTEWKPVVVQKQ